MISKNLGIKLPVHEPEVLDLVEDSEEDQEDSMTKIPRRHPTSPRRAGKRKRETEQCHAVSIESDHDDSVTSEKFEKLEGVDVHQSQEPARKRSKGDDGEPVPKV